MPEKAILTEDYITGEYRADIGWAVLRCPMRRVKREEFQKMAAAANAAQYLLAAAESAKKVLSRIPAFGDEIGSDVSKAELYIALKTLQSAIAAASVE